MLTTDDAASTHDDQPRALADAHPRDAGTELEYHEPGNSRFPLGRLDGHLRLGED